MISYGKIKWGYLNPWYNTHCKRILNKGKLYGYVTKTDPPTHCYSNGQLIEIASFTTLGFNILKNAPQELTVAPYRLPLRNRHTHTHL